VKRTFGKLLPLLVALLLLPLLAGCYGRTAVPISSTGVATVLSQFQEIDRMDKDALTANYGSLSTEIKAAAGAKDEVTRTDVARKQLLLGYTWERLHPSEHGALAEAVNAYNQAAPSGYGTIAYVRLAVLHTYQEQQSQTEGVETIAKLERKAAVQAWERAAAFPPGAQTLVRKPALGFEKVEAWSIEEVRPYALAQADRYYRSNVLYKFFDGLVRVSGGAQRNASYILAIVFIAVLAKLITTPFSVAQFRSMREMQKIQPELKKLQEKYKGGDQREFAKAQMQLFRDHNVNPMSSCLPMIVQTGILIYVYFGIRHFLYRFWGVHFLYLTNLANPDVMPGLAGFPGPLLLLYAVSMFFTQKLISMPAATPEQAQQQRMMSIMMPVFLLFVMKPLPAAFILYWLLQNILMTGHQWLIMRPHRAAMAAGGGTAQPARKKPPSPPPPAAIQRLSQGTKAPGKKRKRR
jgi:YidC/Oxa1 family membrane protein insertase